MRDRLISQTPNTDLTVVGRYNTPSEMPLTLIEINPGYITYQDMLPLIASDGAPIAATGPGTWGQVHAAGRIV